MGTPNTRTDLGSRFSEGARLLWQAMAKKGWGKRELGRELGAYEGEIFAILFGDKLPRLPLMVRAEELFGIASKAWLAPPKKAFAVPGVAIQGAA